MLKNTYQKKRNELGSHFRQRSGLYRISTAGIVRCRCTWGTTRHHHRHTQTRQLFIVPKGSGKGHAKSSHSSWETFQVEKDTTMCKRDTYHAGWAVSPKDIWPSQMFRQIKPLFDVGAGNVPGRN